MVCSAYFGVLSEKRKEKWDNKDGTFTVVPEKLEERELDVLTYNGDEIRAVFTINSEEEPMFKEQAILITLNGIRQEFTVKCGEETVKDTLLYTFNVIVNSNERSGTYMNNQMLHYKIYAEKSHQISHTKPVIVFIHCIAVHSALFVKQIRYLKKKYEFW